MALSPTHAMKCMKDFEWELLKETGWLSDAGAEELLACRFTYNLYADRDWRLSFLKDKLPGFKVDGELASKNPSWKRMRKG